MEILTDIANKIGFDWKLALTHLINLLIIFFLLVKFILPGIKKTIQDRNKKIEEGLTMRNEADKIVKSAEEKSKEIAVLANKKGDEMLAKSELNAKSILADANEKAILTIQEAQKEKDLAKEKGLQDAENLLTKDLSKILTKISAAAFSGKLTPEVNGEFVSKVFKDSK